MNNKYYEAVSVERELPKESGYYLTIADNGRQMLSWFTNVLKDWRTDQYGIYIEYVSHWLRPATGLLLTEEAVKKVGETIIDQSREVLLDEAFRGNVVEVHKIIEAFRSVGIDLTKPIPF